jgi:uncharacterized protein
MPHRSIQRLLGPRRCLAAARVAALLLVPSPGLAAQGPAVDSAAPFTRAEAMVPMRDGVRLYTQVYTPKHADGPLPILVLRTPYGIGGWNGGRVGATYKELADDGYIFVFQDIRGRFKSEGKFVMLRQPRDPKTDPKDRRAIDESTDTFDTIDWLLKNARGNNGRVGMLGVSYGGWLTVMGMLDPHPALKAVSPQASPADMYIGDDFHHNGAFRLSYGFEYAYQMEASKENADVSTLMDRYDTYEWYLNLGPLSAANEKYFHGQLPTWNDFVNHPDYDAFWQRQAAAPWLTRVTVPTLNVAGWWDQEDFYGPVTIYRELERHDTEHKNFLVVGPWNHGGWTRGEGRSLGAIEFGSATGDHYRAAIQAPFFAYYLKDKGAPALAEATVFRTGANQWVQHDAWPPSSGVQERKLYLHGNGTLSFDAPRAAGDEAFESYISDPANPVPYRRRPIEPTYYKGGSGWPIWQVEDQRFVDRRPDVLTWTSEPLKDDVVSSGEIAARLFASTSGTDSDWIVKLIDVYPETYPADQKMAGYQLMIAGEVLRGRYRNGFEKPEAIPPDSVIAYTIPLHTNDHVFQKGHRIMVQVQSTWFPLIDRNPQRFVPNIFAAKAADFQRTVQRVFQSGKFASYISLPVAEVIRQ